MKSEEKQLHIRLPADLVYDLKVKSACENTSVQNVIARMVTEKLSNSSSPEDTEKAHSTRKPHIATVLKHHPLFEGVSQRELKRMEDASEMLCFNKGDIIAREGEMLPSFYIILSGKVKVTKNSLSGKVITLEIRQKDDVIGAHIMSRGINRMTSIVSLLPTEVLAIKRADFIASTESNATIANRLLSIYVVKLRNISDRLMEQMIYGVKRRLLKTIYELCCKDGDVISLTHSEIADMLGTTAESISRILKPLKKNGILDIQRGKIHIKDKGRLKFLVAHTKDAAP